VVAVADAVPEFPGVVAPGAVVELVRAPVVECVEVVVVLDEAPWWPAGALFVELVAPPDVGLELDCAGVDCRGVEVLEAWPLGPDALARASATPAANARIRTPAISQPRRLPPRSGGVATVGGIAGGRTAAGGAAGG
jgi:hypothetical protein